MTERVSALVSVLIHAGLLALLSVVSFRQLHKPEDLAGIELEIFDAEHAMPLPDPAMAAQDAAPAAVEAESVPAELVPPVLEPQPPVAMPPVPQPPQPLQPQPSKPQLAPKPAPPAGVAQLGVGPVAQPQKPLPPAPRAAVAAAPVVTRPAAAPAAASVTASAAPAISPVSSAPPRPRINSSALGRAIAARQGQATQTRISSATIGSAIGRAAPRGAAGLTVRQRTNLEDMIRSQITPCWNPPAADEVSGSVTVLMRIQLDRSGAVVGSPAVSRIKGETAANAAYTRALSGSVRRAVLRCAPLKLPPELFEAWADVELNFDPKDVS